MTIKKRFHNAIIFGIAPASYTLLFLLLMGIWKYFNLPTPEKIYDILISIFQNYGVLAIGIAAFFEGIVIANLYVPGSAVLLLGVTTHHSEPKKVILIIIIAIIAFIISSQINYCAGRYGLRSLVSALGGKKWLEKSEIWYKKYGKKALIAAYIHPNLGGFFAVTSGAAKLPWLNFVATVSMAIIIWNIFWGYIAYISTEAVQKFITSPELILLVLLSWTFVASILGALKTELSTN